MSFVHEFHMAHMIEVGRIPGLAISMPELARPRKYPTKVLIIISTGQFLKRRIRYHFERFRKSYAVSNLDLCFADIDRKFSEVNLHGFCMGFVVVVHGFCH